MSALFVVLVACGGLSSGEEAARELVHRGPTPPYTDAARGEGLGTVTCTYDIDIGADGTPTHVRTEDCPEAFYPQARDSFGQWRWAAASEPSTVTLTIRYKHDASEGSTSTADVLCWAKKVPAQRGGAPQIDLSDCPPRHHERIGRWLLPMKNPRNDGTLTVGVPHSLVEDDTNEDAP